MKDAPPKRTILPSPRAIFSALLAAALLVGIVNAVAYTGRAAARARSSLAGSRESVAKQIAHSLSGHPGPLLLVLPSEASRSSAIGLQRPIAGGDSDITALAFELRLRYECYPRPVQVVRVGPSSTVAPAQVVALRSHDAPAAVAAYGMEIAPSDGWIIRRLDGVSIAARDYGPARASDRDTGGARFRPVALFFGMGALYAIGAFICALGGLSARSWPERLALWHVLGTTAMAAIVMAGYLGFGSLAVWPTYSALGLAALGTAALRRMDGKGATVIGDGRPDYLNLSSTWTRDPVHVLSWVLLGLGFAGIVVTAAGTGLSWDGWTIWQMKARAAFHDGTLAFVADTANDASHRDYPLLVPLYSWWAYAHAGIDHDKLAQYTGSLFAVDLVAAAYAFARAMAGRVAGLIVAAILAAQPMIMRHGSSGYADVPLAAMLLTTTYLLWTVRAGLAGGATARHAALVGLATAGCVLTKHEGTAALVAVSSLLAYPVVLAQRRDRQPKLAVAVAVTVILVCVAPWWALKARYDLRSDMMGDAAYPVVTAALGAERSRETRAPLERLPVVVKAAARSLTEIGPPQAAWGLAWLIAIAGTAMAVATGRIRGLPIREPLVVLGVQAAAYLVAYLTTPHNLDWHLETSLDRLLLHLLPLALVSGVGALVACTASQAGRMLNEDGIKAKTPG